MTNYDYNSNKENFPPPHTPTPSSRRQRHASAANDDDSFARASPSVGSSLQGSWSTAPRAVNFHDIEQRLNSIKPLQNIKKNINTGLGGTGGANHYNNGEQGKMKKMKMVSL